MPELPELEAIAMKLWERFNGKKIESVQVYEALVIHAITPDEFAERITNSVLTSCIADGKFMLLSLSGNKRIVINSMVAGRFRIIERGRRPLKRNIFALEFGSESLVYTDTKRMSRVYLVLDDDFAVVKGFAGRGPPALGHDLTEHAFLERIKRFRGQIKNVLTNQRFITGIGNAYADEVLLYAGIMPFRKRASLSTIEIVSLYKAIRDVLSRYRDMMMKRNLSELATEKRDFLMIHGRGGEKCPLCGGRISEVRANRFKTDYCQTCQK